MKHSVTKRAAQLIAAVKELVTMSDKILAAVEEVKAACLVYNKAVTAYDVVEEEAERLVKVVREAREMYTDAERKLKGTIFEATQS